MLKALRTHLAKRIGFAKPSPPYKVFYSALPVVMPRTIGVPYWLPTASSYLISMLLIVSSARGFFHII